MLTTPNSKIDFLSSDKICIVFVNCKELNKALLRMALPSLLIFRVGIVVKFVALYLFTFSNLFVSIVKSYFNVTSEPFV